MVVIKVFVLTKNEYDLIDDFIEYYGRFVGFSNVVVIDNGSTDERVLAAYARHPGICVFHDHRPMTEQRDMMTDAMTQHKESCDFMMPLDTDEFALWNNAPVAGDGCSSLYAFLQALPPTVDVVRYSAVLFSVPDPDDVGTYVDYSHSRPVADIGRFQQRPFDKIIVRSRAFVAMNPGNHSAILRDAIPTEYTAPELSLLHFHDVGVRRTYERTLAAVVSYGFVRLADDDDLHKQMQSCGCFVKSIGGHHAVHYLRFLARMILIDVIKNATGQLPSLSEMLIFAERCEDWLHCCVQGNWPEYGSRVQDFGNQLLSRVLQHGIALLEAGVEEGRHGLENVRVQCSSDVERFLVFGVGWRPASAMHNDNDIVTIHALQTFFG